MTVIRERSRRNRKSDGVARLNIVTLVKQDDETNEFASAVRAGLTSTPRSLPWTYLYDEAGSRLFESICELPEYYLTRTEDGLLRAHADEMVKPLATNGDAGQVPTIVELGSGSAVKTQRLIAAALRQHSRLHYVPIDVSATALWESAGRLTERFPTLRVTGYVADYRRGLEHAMGKTSGPRLVLFLGSSLGNYLPEEAASLLASIARLMKPADRLLLGTDMVKAHLLLESAYDDAAGVTAAFTFNLLSRINRELGGNFQLDGFRYRAFYSDQKERIESELVSIRDQAVTIPAAGIVTRLTRDEPIHIENSHKYQRTTLEALQSQAGLEEAASWTDKQDWFRLQSWRTAST